MAFAEELQCGTIGDKAIDVLCEGSFDLRHVKSKKRGIVDFALRLFLLLPYLGPLDLSILPPLK